MSFDPHQKFKFIKYEECEEGVDYAITLNPEDTYQYWDIEQRMDAFNKYHKGYLGKLTASSIDNIFIMSLRIEVSPNGRLHYHGILKILNKKHFYLYTIHKLQKIYAYKIDTINKPDVWETYYNKQGFNTGLDIGNDFKKMRKQFFNGLDTIE